MIPLYFTRVIRSVTTSTKKFFFTPSASHSLGLFRIMIGSIALFYLYIIKGDLLALYGQAGIISGEVNDVLVGDQLSLSIITNLLLRVNISEANSLYLITCIYAFALLFLCIGFKTRSSALIAWLINGLFINSSLVVSYGFDTFLNNCILYCALMPTSMTFSVDNWKRTEESNNLSTLANLSRRVLQLHLCIIYFMSGLNKAAGTQWWNGEAIWRSVMQPPLKQFDFAWLAQFPILPMIMGWGVLLIEIGYPFLIWNRKTRKIWLTLVCLLHLGIAYTLNLSLFAALMIIINISAFGYEILITSWQRIQKKIRHLFRLIFYGVSLPAPAIKN